MVIQESITQVLDCSAIMETRDDNSLLSAIAIGRDDVAFTELCARYQKRAFNFAFRILCNSAMAEDAVQEAMISIWMTAKSYQSIRGDVQVWIMSIVMNKSLNLKRSKRRSLKREECMSMEQGRSNVVVNDDVERNELIFALRTHIDQLPDLERTLLACSCTNMSHREIAKLVGVSHPTVSNRIRQALDRLRLELTNAGVAAVVPVLSTKNLFDAVTSGHECPPGMTERIIQRIEDHGKTARSLSRRGFVVRSGGWFATVSIMLVVASALVGVWWLARGQERPAVAVQLVQSDMPVKAGLQHVDRNRERPIHAHWSFEKKSSDDLQVLQGGWNWQSASTNSGHMATPVQSGVLVALPTEIPAHPVVIKISTTVDIPGKFIAGAHWINGQHIVPHKQWFKFHQWHDRARLDMEVYLIDRYMIILHNGIIVTVCDAGSEYPSRQIGLCFAGINVEAISVDSIPEKEIPESFNNIPTLVEQLGVEPQECDKQGNLSNLKR
jgi:RNA polymerase sigma-70 factor (ECF subfamily)